MRRPASIPAPAEADANAAPPQPAPSGPAALISALAGDWNLSRAIDDRRAGMTGRFDGQARFAPDASGLAYEERGTLRLGGAPPLEATRRYLWRAEGDRIRVRFGDGRDFHSFVPGDGARADHWCDPDSYRVAYDFSRWPDWTATWRVSGPAKDYTSVSLYGRA